MQTTQENSKSAIIAEPVDVSRLNTRGTFAEIEYTTTVDGGLQLGLVGHRRIKLLQEIPDSLPTQVPRVRDDPSVMSCYARTHAVYFGFCPEIEFCVFVTGAGRTYVVDRPR